MRRATGETLLSALGLLVLVGCLVAFDPRVRDQMTTILGQDGGVSSAAGLTTMAGEIGSALLASAKDQSLAHAPLLIFGVAGAVLVTFMLRT